MRKLILALFAACTLFVSSASATTLIPPKKYDYPFKGTVYLYKAKDALEMQRVCGTPSAYACAHPPKAAKKIFGMNGCIIIIRESFADNPQWRDALFRHEQAHCNGWPANHPLN